MSLLTEFSDDFSAGIFGTDDGMAVTAAYTPSGGSPKSIPVIFTRSEDLDDSQWRAALQASGTLWVRESDVAAPSMQDSVTLEGAEWQIVRRIGKSAGTWKLEIRRDLRPTFRK